MYDQLPTDAHFPGLVEMRMRADRRKRMTYAILVAIVALVSTALVAAFYIIAWVASLWGASIGDQFTRARDATVRRPARHIQIAVDARSLWPIDR